MMRHLCLASMAGWIGLGLVGARPGLAQGERATPAGPGPSYKLVVSLAKRVHDELTFGFGAPQIVADEWVVFAPRLPELAGQLDVRSSLLPGGLPGRDLSDLGRPLLITRLPAREATVRDRLTVHVQYEATLLARKLERREPGSTPTPTPAVAALTPKDRRAALGSSHHFDFESRAFRRWLEDRQLRRESAEAEVDFARRVFLEIRRGFKLAYSDPMDRSASNVCQAGKSDGLGLTILFTSALRASEVPSRVLCGRWAFPSQPGRNAADEPHVKAEFYAAGVGWVPVDVGSAIVLDKSKEGLVYFGEDKGDFLTLHVDTDMEFDTIFFGRKTMEALQGPSFWVIGSGGFDGLKTPVTSRIRVEPVDPSPPPRRPVARASTPAARRPTRTPKAEPGADPRGVAVAGIVTDMRDNWLMMRADDEEQPVKYVLGDQPDTRLLLDWRSTFAVGRVRLVYKPDSDPRELVAIIKPAPTSGTVAGEVLHTHGWWVEVKPKEGPPDGFAVNYPFNADDARVKAAKEALIGRVKALKVGDVVTIRYTTDFERHRIESLQVRPPAGK
jgi:transglutaminase-like putative cysteine protease